MGIPPEIRKLLGTREASAHASLSCGLQGPIGETHLVVADGQLFVFERESLIGEFTEVEIDPAHPPRLESGTFNDVLHLAIADGAAYELQVSSFDRDAIRQLLDEHAAGPRADAQTPEPPAAETPAVIETVTAPPPTVAPPPAAHAPQEPDPDELKEREEAARDAEKRGTQHAYYGSDPGCAGCLIQAVIFFGGIVAMWFAHEHAMLNIGVVEPTDTYDESPVFVITKIVAVIAGMYLGGKTASIVGGIFRKLNWTGWVAFVKDRAVAIGQRGKWQIVIDSGQPFQFEGGAHSSLSASTDKDGKPTKRSFSVFVRVNQDGKYFTLKTSISRAGHPESVSGIPLKPLSEDWKDQRMITMDNKTFRQVLKRLQDWQ